MKSGLFISQKGLRCGVYQFGRRVFAALSHGKDIRWQYLECEGADEALSTLKRNQPEIIVLNYHPSTMDWAVTSRWRDEGAVVFSIFHEAHQSAADQAEPGFYDFLLCADPTLIPRNPIILPVPRVTIDYKIAETVPPEVFTVGSFGFATHGKAFDRLCTQVNTEFDHACIRLNLPRHDNKSIVSDQYTDAVIASCRDAVTKPGIDLIITQDFLDDGALIQFLGGNTINAFLYEDQTERGISSCTDYALASGRPLAVTKSTMFRHLHELNPSICVEECTLGAIAGRGGRELALLRSSYDYANAGPAWEMAMLNAVDRRGMSRSVPDGRGFNKILDDRSRQAYGVALRLQENHAPDILTRKIERANIQQAFALDTALRLLPERSLARILAIGSFEDTAVVTLKAMGYRVDEIDPNVNGVDLEMFYRSTSAEIAGYDLILCVSVLEHVADDEAFVRMAADLLAPDGCAVFTVDFAEDYVDGHKIPNADERFYTTDHIRGRLMSVLPDCSLLDAPSWREGVEDFHYEGCDYGFAGWVFQKFGGDTLRRSHLDANVAPAWKPILAKASMELAEAREALGRASAELARNVSELAAAKATNIGRIKEIFQLAAGTDSGRDHTNSPELAGIHQRLIYDLRFDGGSRELQLALKLARLARKLTWKVNPSRRRKWGKKKKAAMQAGTPIPRDTPVVPPLADYLDSALITLALHRRTYETVDHQ
jgi:SAM-dependent methyltransferase